MSAAGAPSFRGFLGATAATAALSWSVLRYVLPSALEGARGGVTGLLGWLGQREPLILGVCVFVVLAETGRYWWQLRAVPGPVARTPAKAGSSRRILFAVALVAVAAFVVRSSIVATYRVVGPSMVPTLEMGDRVLVDRTAYGLRLPFSKHALRARVPARGDLVVFPMSGLPGTTGPQAVVKRVVGIPGDTVSFERGVVIVNGWSIPGCDAGPYVDMTGGLTIRGRLVLEYLGDRTYLTVRKAIEQPFPGYTVKPGEVFVLGDDRGVSTDSRVWSEGHGGGVPLDAIDGKVTRVLLGARPDGRFDFSRLLAPPFDLRVRLPGVDMSLTDKRIETCLKTRPASPSPPEPRSNGG
jgi:signal peptidase I